MSLDFLPDKPIDEVPETEQPRYFECYQCLCKLFVINKEDPDDPRFLCLVLDIENKQIAESNSKIFNPNLRKQLKHCPYHLEGELDVMSTV